LLEVMVAMVVLGHSHLGLKSPLVTEDVRTQSSRVSNAICYGGFRLPKRYTGISHFGGSDNDTGVLRF
jgi:hypothetical protein